MELSFGEPKYQPIFWATLTPELSAYTAEEKEFSVRLRILAGYLKALSEMIQIAACVPSGTQELRNNFPTDQGTKSCNFVFPPFSQDKTARENIHRP